MDRNRWSLEGHRALVTGASAGIGLAICRELLCLGAQVLMVAREPTALERARAELEEEFPGPEDAVLALPADVTDEEQRAEILDWAADQGGLHLLVNNAGGNLTRPALDYGEDQWRGIFETNLSLNDMRLNVVMKKLSGWAAIIAVPTGVTGWFGMNVPYLGFGQPLGLWLALGIVVVAVVVLYVMFKRYDWI